MGKQTFQVGIEFIANINDLQSKIKSVTGDISKMGSTSGGTQVQQQFDSLTRSVEQLLTKAQQPIGSQTEFNKLMSELAKAEGAYTSLLGAIQRMQGASDAKKLELLPANQQAQIRSAEAALRTFEGALKSAGSSSKDLYAAQRDLAKQRGAFTTADTEVRQYQSELTQARRAVADLEAEQADLGGQLGEATAKAKDLSTALSAAKRRKNNDDEVASLTTQLEAARGRAQELQGQFDAVGVSLTQARAKETQFNNLLTQATTKANTAKEAIRGIETHMAGLNGGNIQQIQTAFDALRQKAQELNTEAGRTVISLEGIDAAATPENIQKLTSRFAQLKTQGLDQANQSIERTAQSLQGEMAPALQNMRSAMQQAEQAFQRFNARAQEVSQLKSQLTYFFSLTNSVYLLRAALQSAMDTIKELDQVMTEAAVVTKHSVNDMWGKLSEYTNEATKLGAVTKDLYQATTLYYQQGLEGNEVMQVGIETMKMARIAAMDAEEATQAMTAALRGFNMEVDQTNAQRINDVYSKLAAITASDTEQIATAMTKTASIAHSANMEFETTAALLAQIIETTQEAPETAGTAMKTIIARFSEVKSLRAKGQNKGEDSEGEEIDVNKIDKALKSVGISMDGFFKGTEGLDNVLLKLAEKWGELDFETQRYIATMAAGSRQQSRFIAMMSDYARTQELVDAANTSAGASQEQFEKTLDSMEAKLNKLKNAWDEFTMGIANNEVLKTAIDAISALLEGLNWLIEKVGNAFGGVNSKVGETDNAVSKLVKSVLSLGAAFAAIRVGKWALEAGFGAITSGIEAKKKAADRARQKKIGGVQKQDPGKTISTGATEASNIFKKGVEEAGEIFKQSVTKSAGVGAKGEELETEAALAGEAKEAKAGVSGENLEQTIAVESETSEKLASLNAEFAEKQAALDSEIAEKFASIDAESAEAVSAWESEAAEAQAALNQEHAEQRAAIFAEDAETKAALTGEATEGEAGVAQEQAEEIAALDSETSEKIASLTAEFEEGVAGIEGEGAEAAAALQGEFQEKIAALEQEYAEQLAAITGEQVEASTAIAGENAELLAALKGKVDGLPTQKGSNSKSIGTVIAIITALAITATSANQFEKQSNKKSYTSEERLNGIRDGQARLQESTSKLSSEIKGLGQKHSDFKDLVRQIEAARKGTTEWASAIHEARTEMSAIFTQFPELLTMQGMTTTKDGVRMLTDAGWEEYGKKLEEVQLAQMETLYGLQAAQISIEKTQAAENLTELPTSTITQAEQGDMAEGGKIGAWIGGASVGMTGLAIGTKIGASVGSLGGPIGAIIGAAVGALAGSLVGGLAGYAIKGGFIADQGVDPELVNTLGEAAFGYKGEGFSAQTAVAQENGDELIAQFLEDNGVYEGSEQFELLSEYIAENAEEFDKHSQYLHEANEQIKQFGYNLGQVWAQEEGITGDDAETYAAITSIMMGGQFEQRLQQELDALLTGAKKSEFSHDEMVKMSKVGEKLLDEFKKYVKDGEYKYQNDSILYGDTGQEVSEATFYETIAAGRVNEFMQGEVGDRFSVMSKTGGNALKWISANGTVDEGIDFSGLTNSDIEKHINEFSVYSHGMHRLKGNGITEGNGNPDTLGWETYQRMGNKGKDSVYQYKMNYHRTKSYPGGAAYTTDGNGNLVKDITDVDTNTGNDYLRTVTNGDDRIFYYDRDNAKRLDPGYYDSQQDWIEAHNYEDSLTYGQHYYQFTYQDTTVTKEQIIQNWEKMFGLDWTDEQGSQIYDLYTASQLNATDGVLKELIEMSNNFNKYVSTTYTEKKLVEDGYWAGTIEDGKTKTGYGLTFLENVDYGNLVKFIEVFDGLAGTYQGLSEDWLASTLKGFHATLEGLDSSVIDNALNIFTSTDIQDLNDLELRRKQMADAGVGQKTLDFMDKLIGDLGKMGVAMAKIDLETVIKQVQDLNKVVNKINDLEIGATLTLSEEEYNATLNARGVSGQDFVKTEDGFVYLGESMEDLRTTLLETNRILLTQQVDALRRKVQYGQSVIDSGVEHLTWGAVSTWEGPQMEALAKGVIEGAAQTDQDLWNLIDKKGVSFTSGTDGTFTYQGETYDYTTEEGQKKLDEIFNGTALFGKTGFQLEDIYEGQIQKQSTYDRQKKLKDLGINFSFASDGKFTYDTNGDGEITDDEKFDYTTIEGQNKLAQLVQGTEFQGMAGSDLENIWDSQVGVGVGADVKGGFEFVKGKDGEASHEFKYDKNNDGKIGDDETFDYMTDEGAALLTDLFSGTVLDGVDFEAIEQMYFGNWDNLDPSTQEGVKAVFGEIGDAYLNYSAYKNQLETGVANVKTETLSGMTGQEMLYAVGTDDGQGGVYTAEDVDRVLQAKEKEYGTAVAGYETGKQIEAQVKQEAYDEAIKAGKTQAEAEQLANDAIAGKWEEFHRLGRALAYDAVKNQNEFTQLTSVFNKYAQVVTKANRGTSEYNTALSKLQGAIEDTFNIKLSPEFMLEHQDLVERALAGEEGAWERLLEYLKTSTAEAFHAIRGFTLDVDKVAKTISPTIGITTSFDGSGLAAAQLGLQLVQGEVVATDAELSKLTSLYDLMGATVEYETEDAWMLNGAFVDKDMEGATQVKRIKSIEVKNTGKGGLDTFSPSSGGEKTKWENPYDKLHNELEKINDVIREREKLERRYQSLLDRQLLTLKEARDLYKQTMDAYQSEADLSRSVINQRYSQIEDKVAETPGLEKYVQVVDDGYGGKSIRIDYEAFEAKDGKKWEDGDTMTDAYDDIKEWLEDIYDKEATLDEIADGMWELVKQGRDEYLDLEEQIIDALTKERQDEIDKLSEINDSITDTNSKLLEAVQKQIDDYRQARENEKTEEELSDKQRRLIYLQQDTSGANDLEIMQLQKEIDEGVEDHTDALVDQKISELQEQNDTAAEQRQRQIDLLQAQLDHEIESGAFNDDVTELIKDVIENGLSGSKLEEILKSANGWDAMTELGQMVWLEELTNTVQQAIEYRDKKTSIEDLMETKVLDEGSSVTFITADDKTVTGTVQSDGTIKGDNGALYSGVARDWLGNYSTNEKFKDISEAPPEQPKTTPWSPSVGDYVKVSSGAKFTSGASISESVRKNGVISGKAGAFKVLKDAGNGDFFIGKSWTDTGVTGKMNKKYLTQYKTGGLADFTGPAWLDGTKSKPEYILNARQTKAFFTLVDVLSGLKNIPQTSTSTENNGDSVYDIDINVESIDNDYSVEQMAEAIKRLIVEDAQYRNNNAINLSR